MKVNEIKAIAALMAEHDLTEFKVETDEMRLSIKRGAETVAMPHVLPAPVAAAPAAIPAPAAPAAADAAPADENLETIDSPIVGTFYRAPSPESDTFVEVGTKVTPETVVCIIEAMKVMNEIKAEKSGVIKEILVKNAEAVEFGQALFVIE